jgi:TPR repeat protein
MNTDTLLAKAFSQWEKGRYRSAFSLFLKAAHRGNHTAEHNIGFFYDVGKGTKQSPKEALYWYKRAWRGDKQASTCSNIARVYADLNSHRRSMFWWKKAMSKKDGDVALDLARYLMTRARYPAKEIIVRRLLRSALLSKNITEESREEAQKLLKG